jgi:hypothetical protein
LVPDIIYSITLAKERLARIPALKVQSGFLLAYPELL